MSSNEILSQKFERCLNGYKPDEVDDFLQNLYVEYKTLETQNAELDAKLQKLALKITEYREQEDDIKKALIVAQRESSRIISSAKRESDEEISVAKAQRAKMIKEAEEILSDAQRTAVATEKEIAERISERQNILRQLVETVGNFRSASLMTYKKFLYDFENIQTTNETENQIQELLKINPFDKSEQGVSTEI